MTSGVKSRDANFLHVLTSIFCVIRRVGASKTTTVDHAAIRGLATTLLVSVGYLPRSRPAGFLQPLNANEGCTIPGLRLFR